MANLIYQITLELADKLGIKKKKTDRFFFKLSFEKHVFRGSLLSHFCGFFTKKKFIWKIILFRKHKQDSTFEDRKIHITFSI